MNFIDAVNNMINGRRLIRQGWAGYYIAILSNQNYIWHIDNGTDKPVVNSSIYAPSVDDILANDWMVK